MSLSAGVLALLSVCIGIAPIPLTGYVCFPAAGVLAALALVSGLRSIRQIRTRAEKGREYAVAGIALGVVGLLGLLCMGLVGVALWSQLVRSVHLLQ